MKLLNLNFGKVLSVVLTCLIVCFAFSHAVNVFEAGGSIGHTAFAFLSALIMGGMGGHGAFYLSPPYVISNVNLDNVNNTGNTGKIKNFLEPALVKAALLLPKGYIFPAASMINADTFNALIQSMLIADDRSERAFMLYQLDDFKNGTKAASVEDTGAMQHMVGKYMPVFNYRYMSKMGNFIELLNFHLCEDEYDVALVDANGTTQGTEDPTKNYGLAPYTLDQFFVEDRDPITDKTANKYPLSIRLADNRQINQKFKYFASGLDIASLQGLENVVLYDVTSDIGVALGISATTDVVLAAKMGQDSTDFIELYEDDLTDACFTAFDLTASSGLTIATAQFGEIVDGHGQTIFYAWLTLSAAPTGDLVRYQMSAPSVVNGIMPNANVVNEVENAVTFQY